MKEDVTHLVTEIIEGSIKTTGTIIAIDQTMLWQMVNFFILVFIMSKFLIKPVKGIIEKRHAKVTAEIEHAKTDKEESSKLKTESEKEIKASKIKAQEIINEAIKKAEEVKEEILKAAHVEREKRLKAAEAEAFKMKEQVKKELRDEMFEIAVKLAEKMVKEKIDNKIDSKLIDEFIEEVGVAK